MYRSPLLILPLLLATLLLGCSGDRARTAEDAEAGSADDRSPKSISVPTASGDRAATGRSTRHHGTNHAHIHRRGHGYGSDKSKQQMKLLVAHGANAVALTPFAYQPTADAAEIHGYGPDDPGATPDPTLRDADVAAEVAAAHELGLRVMLKPHIWAGDFHHGEEWHGTIRQNSAEEHARWFASYRRFILGWTDFAAEHNVAAISLGTELVEMTTTYPDDWRALIAEIRERFDGIVTYTAHWEKEYEAITFWDELDYIGIAAYFPLDAPAEAGVDELVAAWRPWIDEITTVADRFDRPYILLEAGYRPVSATWHEPWAYSGGTPDTNAQVIAFDALFRAFDEEPRYAGLYIWKTFTDKLEGFQQGEQLDFSFLDLPTAATVKKHWYQP